MKPIKMLVMDVDGTLTDGHIHIGENGEMMKTFHVRDGYAIVHILPDYGIVPVIITGRKSKIVEQRAKELKITHLHQGISDKLAKLKEIAQALNATADEIAYIGDDVNDLTCIQFCKYTACPADADPTILPHVNYVCTCAGGHGAVREFVHYLLND